MSGIAAIGSNRSPFVGVQPAAGQAEPGPQPPAPARHPALGVGLTLGGLAVAAGSIGLASGGLRVVGALAGVAAAAVGVELLRRAVAAPAPPPPSTGGHGPLAPGETPNPGHTPAPGGGTTPGPAGTATLHFAQFNAHNLFDTVDDPHHQDDVPTAAASQLHLAKLALAIRDNLGAPDVLTMEEVESQQALDALLARPELQGLGYRGIVLEGTDPRGIDVAIVWREGHVHLDHAEQFDPRMSSPTGRSVHVYTRPPLVATFDVGATAGGTAGASGAADAHNGAGQLTVVAGHFTSKLGGADAAARRKVQAQVLGDWIDARQAAAPGSALIVAGDLNMTNAEPEFAPLTHRADGSSRGMVEAAGRITTEGDRYSWGRASQRQLLDHVLVSPGLAGSLRDVRIDHFDTTATRAQLADPTTGAGASDHDPFAVTVDVPITKRPAGDGKSTPG